MQTPILYKDITPFSKDNLKDFKFYYNGDVQIIENNLIIENTDTNVVVYDATIQSFNLYHRLASNTLENGKLYRAKIRIKGSNGVWSDFSDMVLFHVLATPSINFQTIDFQNQNKVYAQAPLLKAIYSQENGEQLQVYSYYLYDSNQTLIKKYPDIFYYGNGLLEQQLDGLESARVYYIEIKTLSINKQVYSTGLISFIPTYSTPKMSGTISATNIKEYGALEVEANIMQIIGYYKDENGVIKTDFTYINNDKVDLRNGKIIGFQQNVNFPKDVSIQLWCEKLSENMVFLTMVGSNSKAIFYKYKKRIHGELLVDGIKISSHFISDVFVDNGGAVSIGIKIKDELVRIEVMV